MRKLIAALALVLGLASGFPASVSASEGVIPPTSKFYFLQSWGEEARLWLTFSAEGKLNYLLQLTERRTQELTETQSGVVANRYESHFRQMNSLSLRAGNEKGAVERVKEASLRQQEVLAGVYVWAPEAAKEAIINAQGNSSAHVEKMVERVEGAEKAGEYIQRVARIQQMERMGQVEQLERAPMEGGPSSDPSQNVPQGLREGRGLLPGQELSPLGPGLEEQGGGEGGERMEPAGPVEMEAPAGQN